MANLDQDKFFKPSGSELQFDAKAFGLELKKYRLRNNLTQRELGEKWGLSRYTIIRAENGRNISWESAYRLFARLAREVSHEEVIY